ncbi:MAG: non-hydrolyzing UDP-N-acetylglucosamine 2-epimerase [Gemmatimonadota bacterium]
MNPGGDGTDAVPQVLLVVGTRPEAIKMAPVWNAFAARPEEAEVRLALTGQHTDMVDQVLEAFSLTPDYDLGIMKEGQDLYDVVHGALEGLRDVVRDMRPDVLLVQGDTATVFVGSLVGYFEGVRVGHVEAGLRSHDKWAPFPEEMFRRLCDVLSDYYFAPTLRAREALEAEGVPRARVHVTGNTVVDALLGMDVGEWKVRDETLARVMAGARRFVLLTAHRRESFGEPLREVFRAVRALADAEAEVEIVYPVHPNPNVRGPAREMLADHPRIHLTDPLVYLDLVSALRHADLVLTDSGGIQEEAPTFGVPVLVLREVTERPEGVEAGVAELVGTDEGRILERARAALARGRGGAAANPYGDGRAGERIADIVLADLSGSPRRTEDWKA